MNSATSKDAANFIELISEYKDNYNKPEVKYECSNCVHRVQPVHISTLADKYSTSMAIAATDLDKKDIHKTIFNDKFSVINPTRESDYRVNYQTPDKSDYRKKRNQTYYPNYGSSCVNKNTKSEYNEIYTDFKDKKHLAPH